MFLFDILPQDSESSESEVETWRGLQFCLIVSTHSWVCWCRSHVTDKRGSFVCSEQVQYSNNTSIRLFALSIFSEGLRISYFCKHNVERQYEGKKLLLVDVAHASCSNPFFSQSPALFSFGDCEKKPDCTLPHNIKGGRCLSYLLKCIWSEISFSILWKFNLLKTLFQNLNRVWKQLLIL